MLNIDNIRILVETEILATINIPLKLENIEGSEQLKTAKKDGTPWAALFIKYGKTITVSLGENGMGRIPVTITLQLFSSSGVGSNTNAALASTVINTLSNKVKDNLHLTESYYTNDGIVAGLFQSSVIIPAYFNYIKG